jgi:hypothetical protein
MARRKETLTRAPFTPLKKLDSYRPSLWANATALGGYSGRSLRYGSMRLVVEYLGGGPPAGALEGVPIVDEAAYDGQGGHSDVHVQEGGQLIGTRGNARTLHHRQ